MPKIKIEGYLCIRCKHTWIPRENSKPTVCPKCKSPYGILHEKIIRWKMIMKDNINTKYFISPDSKINLENEDSLVIYDNWESPIVIISDGPYGVKGFKDDLPTYEGLDKWYEPHIKKWSEKATTQTTLWFWNTEIGWATVHPILSKYGWNFTNCHVWDKGIAYAAGKTNSKSLRKLPIVTEICVQYVKKPIFKVNGNIMSTKEWLRYEWKRTGLPFYKTNDAAKVKNAASRKYFTKCHLWYPPPPDTFEKIVNYANEYGDIKCKPYFSLDGEKPLGTEEWKKMRAKFKCPIGITNVWHEPALNGKERIKNGSKAYHLNQKPLKLTELIIDISSDKGDLVWDPFGGLATTAIASHKLNRKCNIAEKNSEIFRQALERVHKYLEYGAK
jgi:DNA modification methylase